MLSPLASSRYLLILNNLKRSDNYEKVFAITPNY